EPHNAGADRSAEADADREQHGLIAAVVAVWRKLAGDHQGDHEAAKRAPSGAERDVPARSIVRIVPGRWLAHGSGPAYLPAVCGNIDLTIFMREMSVVASMCRKIAASRNSFSTPKSSIMPLPPCSSTACWATFMISSDANSLTMLHSVSASA